MKLQQQSFVPAKGWSSTRS